MELFCRDRGVNVYTTLWKVCLGTDCHILTLGKCGPNNRETRNPKYHTNWTSAHALGPGGIQKGRVLSFRFQPGVCEKSWSLDRGLRCCSSSRAMTTSKNSRNGWYVTVFSKKGQMSVPNINVKAFHFFQKSPSQLLWMCLRFTSIILQGSVNCSRDHCIWSLSHWESVCHKIMNRRVTYTESRMYLFHCFRPLMVWAGNMNEDIYVYTYHLFTLGGYYQCTDTFCPGDYSPYLKFLL